MKISRPGWIKAEVGWGREIVPLGAVVNGKCVGRQSWNMNLLQMA